MPGFTPTRSDAIRAGLIRHAGQKLHPRRAFEAKETDAPAAGVRVRPRRHRPQWIAAAIALVLVGGITAGAVTAAVNGGNQIAAEPTQTTPPPPTSPANTPGLDAVWLDGGRTIGLVVNFDVIGVCALFMITSYQDGVLEVGEHPVGDPGCQTGDGPRVDLLTPEGIDPTEDLEIHVTTALFSGEVYLPGEPGLVMADANGYTGTPSASWFGDGGLVILTRGSTTCPPIFRDALATGDAEVTATFWTAASPQVCTDDLAPHVTIRQVPGITKHSGAQLILAGTGFDNQKVQIVGESTPGDSPAETATWLIDENGIGPVKVGAGIETIPPALAPFVYDNTFPKNHCEGLRTFQPTPGKGGSFTIETADQGSLRAIGVSVTPQLPFAGPVAGSPHTAEGVTLGSSLADLQRAYPSGRMQPGSEFVARVGAGSLYFLVSETDPIVRMISTAPIATYACD